VNASACSFHVGIKITSLAACAKNKDDFFFLPAMTDSAAGRH